MESGDDDTWLVCLPDNCAFDAAGRLWVSTDQGSNWVKSAKADGLYAVDTGGDLRGRSRLFFRALIGAEVCGPTFTADGETLFIAVQHPGTDGVRQWKPFARPSTFGGSGDALAGLRGEHAAAPIHRGHPPRRWRKDRGLSAASHISLSIRGEGKSDRPLRANPSRVAQQYDQRHRDRRRRRVEAEGAEVRDHRRLP